MFLEVIVACKRLFVVWVVFLLSTHLVLGQTLIINEVSNGPTGNQEFVEFVVVDEGMTYDCGSNIPPCIDIRGWIFDDNSGYHGSGGIAEGALRFSNHSLWSCVPLGTIILLYNDADPNVNLPPDDLSLNDDNCRIVAPISNAALFEQNLTTPGAAACSYPSSGWVAGGDWELTFLANSGDCARLVDLSGCEVFSLCWASCSDNSLIYFPTNGSGSKKVWFFNGGDPMVQSNWSEGSTLSPSAETPGAPNNAANQAYIGQFNNNCIPIEPIEATVATSTPTDCGCTGTASASASGSIPGYTYQWTDENLSLLPGQTNATATNLCAGIHYVIVTSSIGCTDTATVTIASNGGGAIQTTETQSVCANTTVTYPNGSTAVITAPTTYISQLTTSSGCDSIITTNVVLVPFLASTQLIAVCANSTVTYPDGTSEIITGNTTQTSNLVATTGCDSVVTTVVTVIPTYTTTENRTVCANSTITYPDGTTGFITSPTSYVSNLIGALGCDSVITTNVTLSQGFEEQVFVEVCPNSPYTFPNGETQTITSSTTQTSVFTTGSGCDSTIVTTVSITAVPVAQQTIEVCAGDAYTFPDGVTRNNITNNMVYTSAIPTTTGCDSIIETSVYVASAQATEFEITPSKLGTFNFDAAFSITTPENTAYEWSIFDTDSALIHTSADTAFSYQFENIAATYTVCVASTSQAGCAVSKCKLLPAETELTVYIPNAFTPEIEGQTDRLNDVFRPVIGGAIVANYTLTIFDRWGKQLFVSNDESVGWTGQVNARDVPIGLYVFRLTFTTKGLSFTHQYTGTVTLVR